MRDNEFIVEIELESGATILFDHDEQNFDVHDEQNFHPITKRLSLRRFLNLTDALVGDVVSSLVKL